MGLFGKPKGPQYKFTVTGLDCGNCVAKAKKALKEIPDVQKAKVSLDMKNLTVTGAKEIDPQTVILKMEELGFEAKLEK